MPDLNQLLEMSPAVALMFGLNGAIWLLKKTNPIPGWIIPWIAVVAGTALYPLIAEATRVSAIRSPLTAQMISGFGIGLASVGTNNIFIKTLQRMGFWQDDDAQPAPLATKDETKGS